MVSSGIAALDELLGGYQAGDNVVWISERDDVYDALEEAFVASAAAPTLVVVTTRAELRRPRPDHVDVVDATPGSALARPGPLADELERRFHDGRRWTIVIDGLAVLARRWGRDAALAFFVRSCPSMLQAGAVEQHGRHRGRLVGRKQRIDVGHQQDTGPLLTSTLHGSLKRRDGRVRFEYRDRRPGEQRHGQISRVRHRMHNRGLADALRAGQQHAELSGRAELLQQLGMTESQVEPLGQRLRHGARAGEVGDRDGFRQLGLRLLHKDSHGLRLRGGLRGR